MTAFENLSATQKIRASLHRDVRAICTEALHLLGMEMTKPAMEILAELIYRKLSTYGTDLEAFAKHAKRNSINSEDVKLLVRRNPSLKTHLNKIQPSNALAKDKRRKTVASTSKFTTPSSKTKENRPNSEGDKRIEDKENTVEPTDDQTEVGKEISENKELGESSRRDDSMERRISEVEQMSVDDTIVDLTFD